MYISYLTMNKECKENEIWLNTSSGVLFRGPAGPDVTLGRRDIDCALDPSIFVPPTVDMLKDDTSLRFFSQFQVDNNVLDHARQLYDLLYDRVPIDGINRLRVETI
ncbi:hypothetical protein MPER_02298 [Moniliophthora perniciosa FA553]|nr:hypothetical protein MPER_02298 [Moniliophthora perniciosa FA553]